MTADQKTQVDFYVLDTDSLAARGEFVARLLNKLQKLGMGAVIAVDSAAEARQLSELLWSYPPESFLPHAVDPGDGAHSGEDSARQSDELFVISARSPLTSVEQEVLINLRRQPPACHAKLARLAEVVIQNEAILAASRQNFRFYREQGYTVESHDIRS
ncbi:DNA polymerase III subunit chi [Proteobacteria bacterium 005FR1]|nr:DNA polymerase III subunit chi [Proteobacteria bacterium 005FR1]